MGTTRIVAGLALIYATVSWAQQQGTVNAPIEHLVPDAVHTGIVINIPQRMLFLKESGKAIASYPVGLGRPEWPTFVGPFTIVRKEVDPVWDVPLSIQEEQRRAGKRVVTRVPPGPSNPLGKYWLGLNVPGYGIHGTTVPSSISHFQSHGCIRLRAVDIADLFGRVNVGTVGETVYEPVLLRIVNGDVLLEAHPDVYRRLRSNDELWLRETANEAGIEDAIDWQLVRATLTTRDGRPHLVAKGAQVPSREPR